MPELLAARRMTQIDLALMIGVSGGLISQVISGKTYFSYLAALKAARVLKCRMEDLYEVIND